MICVRYWWEGWEINRRLWCFVKCQVTLMDWEWKELQRSRRGVRVVRRNAQYGPLFGHPWWRVSLNITRSKRKMSFANIVGKCTTSLRRRVVILSAVKMQDEFWIGVIVQWEQAVLHTLTGHSSDNENHLAFWQPWSKPLKGDGDGEGVSIFDISAQHLQAQIGRWFTHQKARCFWLLDDCPVRGGNTTCSLWTIAWKSKTSCLLIDILEGYLRLGMLSEVSIYRGARGLSIGHKEHDFTGFKGHRYLGA